MRADLLVVRVDAGGSGQTPEVVAKTRSCNVSVTAAYLETTNQDDGIYESGEPGKVSHTLSGEYLLAAAGTPFTTFHTAMKTGTTVNCDVLSNGTDIIQGVGVITGLELTGGTSDAPATGSYTIRLTGAIT